MVESFLHQSSTVSEQVMKSSSSHQKGPSAPGPEEARSGFENEFQVTLEECIKENSYQKLRNLYAKLMTKERHSSLNMSNLQDNVIPTLQAKVASLKEELEPLRVSKEKGDSSIQRLKTLSQELTRKLESVVQDSKRAQMEEKKIRESQTNSFSEKVKEISARLQALEVNKERMIQENNELRADLAKCIALASEDSSAEALDDHSSFGLEDEEDDLNVEHEPMIFEDYRSHSVRLSEVDSDLQDELSQFVGRFQELSTSLTKNNTELLEHRYLATFSLAILLLWHKIYIINKIIYFFADPECTS